MDSMGCGFHWWRVGVACAIACGVLPAMHESASAGTVNVVPWPASVKAGSGELELGADSRIVAGQAELKPLAEVLAEDIFLLTGRRMTATAGRAKPGDIALELSDSLKGEAHTVRVTDTATVVGGSYAGVAAGTATLVQLLGPGGDNVSLPRVTIADKPHSRYRGLLVDVARQWYSVDTLKQIIILCRLYKIGQIQLHLTDDQSFTFPSTAFPKLATKGRHYSLVQLHDLVKFADARSVTLVPEFETPGHSSAMRRAMPELFDSIDPATGKMRNLGVLNMATEQMYQAMDTLVSEMSEVFKSSPYFHIGCDEVWLAHVGGTPEAKAYMARHGLRNPHDLYLKHIVRMHEIVKRHGKRTVLWEGFGGTGSPSVQIPKDILVIAWETMYQLPQSLLKNGYTLINCAWKPLYVVNDTRWAPEYIYGWNMWRWENHWVHAPSFTPIQIEPTDRVIGAQMCVWEQAEYKTVPGLRKRLAAMSERIWNPKAGRAYEDFNRRFQSTDRVLSRVLHPFAVSADGLAEPDYEGPFFNTENCFGRSVTLTLTPAVADTTIRYTLDQTVPTSESPRYTAPLTIDRTTTIKAQAFDAEGGPRGRLLWRTYELHPIKGRVDGLLTHIPESKPSQLPSMFGTTATVTLTPAMPGGTIRYTLNGRQPNSDSTAYTGPITLTDTARITARFFDAGGKARGAAWGRALKKVDYQETLTTGKPVTASKGVGTSHGPENAANGLIDIDRFWGCGGPAPQWWRVDLGKAFRLGEVHVFPYWDGRRYYQYTVEVSTDAKKWTEVVDGRKNTAPATPQGHRHTLKPIPGRYVRVTMLKNSANPGLHLVEVRAFAAGDARSGKN